MSVLSVISQIGVIHLLCGSVRTQAAPLIAALIRVFFPSVPLTLSSFLSHSFTVPHSPGAALHRDSLDEQVDHFVYRWCVRPLQIPLTECKPLQARQKHVHMCKHTRTNTHTHAGVVGILGPTSASQIIYNR